MNIVLINQFFPPSQAPTGVLLSDLAGELVRRGHVVTVITSVAGCGVEAGAPAGAAGGVRVIRVGPGGSHSSGLWAKLGDYGSFFRRAVGELSRLPERPDVLVCMTTPPFCGRIGARLRKRQGIPYVLWCMDLYPEALSAHGLFRPSHPVYRGLLRLSRGERERASAVITLGPDMSSRVHASAPKAQVEEIPVWSHLTSTPEALAGAKRLRRQRDWADDELILMYSGNMGRAHRAEDFAGLARILREKKVHARVVMSGAGPRRAEWERLGSGHFEFIPAATDTACAAHLLSADIHLVSQRPEWTGLVVPSKFQAACALGRPVIYTGPPHSAIGLWIQDAEAGWVIPPGEARAMEPVVKDLQDREVCRIKGVKARRLFEDRFSFDVNCARLCDLLETTGRVQL